MSEDAWYLLCLAAIVHIPVAFAAGWACCLWRINRALDKRLASRGY
jgi:hypothetical protein